MKPDFGGYATRNDLKCTDGVTIRNGAFKHQDGQKVPLVWQHNYGEPANVLGHAILKNRPDGVYADAYFNTSESAKNAKELIRHGDVEALSINANKLQKRGKDVLHGQIREVSLVLAGANPGAYIDYVDLQHSADDEYDDAEAIIYNDETTIDFEDSDEDETETFESVETNEQDTTETLAHADAEKKEPPMTEEKTVQDVFDSMSEEQKNVVYYLIGQYIESQGGDAEEIQQDDTQGEQLMHMNIFDQEDDTDGGLELTHSQMGDIFTEAQRNGSLRESVISHAVDYGIEDVDLLFPDAKTITSHPDFVKRKTEWVAGVLSGTNHTPFSRIKTLSADLTYDTARAKGYIKGSMKKDEFFGLQKRTTGPTTIYKKQRMDRDDLLDITDFDTVAWLKAEMRMMLEEEIARAILIGDGRDLSDVDKIKDPVGQADGLGIRSIYKDDDFYANHILLEVTADNKREQLEELYDSIVRGLDDYEGTGTPTWYTYSGLVTDLMLWRDADGHRMFNNIGDLASSIGVKEIVRVPVMKNISRTSGAKTLDLWGIIVNLSDYNIGTDRGGETTFFSDFDINYNREHYLYETRLSGALVHPKSALVLEHERA